MPRYVDGASEDFDTLYVFGAGGHGREIAWLADEIWSGSLSLIHI